MMGGDLLTRQLLMGRVWCRTTSGGGVGHSAPMVAPVVPSMATSMPRTLRSARRLAGHPAWYPAPIQHSGIEQGIAHDVCEPMLYRALLASSPVVPITITCKECLKTLP